MRELNEGLASSSKEEITPVNLLHFESEAAIVVGDDEDKSRTVEKFIKNGGVFRTFDLLDEYSIEELPTVDDLLGEIEDEGISNVSGKIVNSSHSRHQLSGAFFEQISWSTLDSRLSGMTVLSPKEAEDTILGIEKDRNFSTIPDGIVFRRKRNLVELVGVSEYKTNPADYLLEQHWIQYENLLHIANTLSSEGIRSGDKGVAKKVFSERGEPVKKVGSNVSDLKIYYVVPKGLSASFSFSGAKHAEVLESPFTAPECRSLLGALCLDYVDCRERISKNG